MMDGAEFDQHMKRGRPSIPIPRGGFASNEAEARWLVDTLALRFEEGLRAAGLQAKADMRGLYDLLLLSLDAASKRGGDQGW